MTPLQRGAGPEVAIGASTVDVNGAGLNANGAGEPA